MKASRTFVARRRKQMGQIPPRVVHSAAVQIGSRRVVLHGQEVTVRIFAPQYREPPEAQVRLGNSSPESRLES